MRELVPAQTEGRHGADRARRTPKGQVCYMPRTVRRNGRRTSRGVTTPLRARCIDLDDVTLSPRRSPRRGGKVPVMSSSENPIYQIFAGKALAELAPAASAIGLAEQTARDLIWRGNFPVKTVKIGRKRLVVVDDLARYYAELVGIPTPTTIADADAPAADVHEPRKRGRPRKYPPQSSLSTEQHAARMAELRAQLAELERAASRKGGAV